MLAIVDPACFNVNDRVELVIEVIDEVESQTEGVEGEGALSNTGAGLGLRELSFKVCVEFSIINYKGLSLFPYIPLGFILVQLMHTCIVLAQTCHLQHLHLVIYRFVSPHLYKVKRISKLLFS